MNRNSLAWMMVVACLLLVFCEPALAGPGGKIARAAFESFWGRVALVGLVIVFAPFILLGMLRERRAVRRANRDLQHLASLDPRFEWLALRQRAQICFERVHSAWRREDTSEAAAFMTDWYWQNQQLVFLDKWEAEGLVNHCTVKKLGRVRPLLVQPLNAATDRCGSKVVLQITALMQDYLARRDNGEIVEGSKKFKNVETLWTFELADGEWKVANIDDAESLSEYLALVRDLPAVDAVVAAQRTGAA